MVARDGRLNRAVIALAIVGFLLLAGGVLVGSVISGAGGGIGTPSSEAVDTSQQNPQDIESQRDLSAIERQLAERAAERIQSGEIDLSGDDVGNIRESLGESEFNALVERYAEISEETGSENRAAAFLQIRSDRQAYAAAIADYQRAYRVYNGTANYSDAETETVVEEFEFITEDDVRSNETTGGTTRFKLNESQERALARTLETRWYRVNRTADRLIDSYRTLEEIDNESYAEGIETVEQSRENVSRRHERVRDEWFVRLQLTAATSDPKGSFLDPIEVSGRVAHADGTPYGNGTMQLRINDQRYVTETNATGHYTVGYRPATIRTNATEVPVEIVPTPDSMVIGLTRPNVPVDIERSTPTVAVSTPPRDVGFNETLTVTGHVGGDAGGAANVSYRVLTAGNALVEGRTNETGHIDEELPLPADVPAGDQQLRLAVGDSNRALTPTNETTTVTVRERPTELSIEANQTDERTIQLAGELVVPDGPGVPGRSIELLVNGSNLGTTTTGVNGTFETSLVVPESEIGSGASDSAATLSVGAAYQDERANLGASNAETAVILTTETLWGVLAGVGLFVLIAGGVGVTVLSWRRGQSDSFETFEEPAGWSDALVEDGRSSESLLESAYDTLADRPVIAAQLGYAALRTCLEAEYGGQSAQTHWEFYRACEASADEEIVTTLRNVTELYERVVFASEPISAETVKPMLDRTERVVGSMIGADE
ncbi:hypothetical protein [Natronomonas salsuginis]|uniref:DUF4129 domain-containing protein n=1 Tax=Natronomonas salsuginis TaxID=2217661 RepID=A0A4U5J9N6_9EURY|nr:hypothetical protein [Natronomonas salsuginis]TKR25474.1 hypothetical protein DM868_08600 [Natronomonas salsuginis]